MVVDVTERNTEHMILRTLRKASPGILDGMIEILNALMESFPSKIKSSGENYLLACILHAVWGDYRSIEALFRVQPPETEGAIVFLSPGTGETHRISAPPEWVQWFSGFLRALGWIATMPGVGEQVGRCAQCGRLYRVIRKGQRICGKTCPKKGTLKRDRGEYHRAFQEFGRRVKNGKDPRSVLASMALDSRYRDVIEKYGSGWLDKSEEV